HLNRFLRFPRCIDLSFVTISSSKASYVLNVTSLSCVRRWRDTSEELMDGVRVHRNLDGLVIERRDGVGARASTWDPRPSDPLIHIRYACIHWIDHLSEIDSSLHNHVGLYDGEFHKFLQKHFLHWLEALSLMRSMSVGVAMIRRLGDLLVRNQ